MTTRTLRRAAACALLTTTALCLPAIAHAETAAPKFIDTIDDHSVDLVNGLPYFTMEEGGIGSGPGRVAMKRIYAEGAGFLDNWTGGLYQLTSGGVTKYYVQFNGISETFSGSGTNWTNDNADGGTLDAVNFIYTARDGTRIGFDVLGEDKIGCPGVAGLGACKSPVSVVRPDGLTFSLNYDIKVVCVDQPGEPCATEHDHARLSSVTSSAGYTMVIAYASSTGPYTATDPWYQRTSVTFGNTFNAPNPAPTITYSRPSSTVTNVTDPAGRVWVLTTDTSGRLVGIRRPGSVSDNITYGYGADGTINTSTKDGVTNSYSRSIVGSTATETVTNPLSQQMVVTSDASKGRPTSYRDGLNRTTSYIYDANSRLAQVTAPENNYVVYNYDLRGNVTSTVLHDKTNTNTITTSASFDATCSNIVKCNKPNTTTDAKGNVTNYTYDATRGVILTVTRAAPSTGAVQPQTRFSYALVPGAWNDQVYMLTGVSACQTTSTCTGTSDEVKSTVSYPSSANNLLPTSITRGDGTGTLTATTAMTYDSHGNITTVNGPLADTLNAPTLTLTDTTAYQYDAADQLVGVISPDPDGSGTSGGALLNRAVRLTYRSDGQVSKQELGTTNGQDINAWAAFSPLQTVDIGFDSNNRPSTAKLSAGGSDYALTQTTYDALGRVDCTATRMNTAVYGSLPSSACSLSTQGNAGPDRISKLVYDAASQTTQLQVGVGTSSASNERTLAYTSNGRLQSLTDAENNKTTYVYDGFDRLSQTQFPSTMKGVGTSDTTNYEQLSYDAKGNITAHRRRDGTVIAYTLDNLDRVTLKTLPSGEPAVSYAYDNLGRLTSSSKTTSSVSFTYDALSRKLTEAGPQGTVTSSYDQAGRRTSIAYPVSPGASNLTIGYTYLTTGEVSTVADGATNLATYSYDNVGNRTGVTLGNGNNASYTFDPVSRLSSVTNRVVGGTNNLTINGIAYNPASQITSITRSNDLFAWSATANVSPNYASNGLNQYTVVGGKTYTYSDGRGNLTSDGTNSFCYSSENLLTGENGTCAAPAISLSYDPLLRLSQVAGSTTLRFAYDGLRMLADYDGANTLQHRYVFGPGLDEPIVEYSNTGVRTWLSSDERGSIIARTDGAGALTAANKYDEYGIPAADTSGNSLNAGLFQYTGQAWIGQIGMYYYKARFYSQTLGRFMQTDPIGYADSPNLYAAVLNDPINLTDPTGLYWVCREVAVGVTDSQGRTTFTPGTTCYDNGLDFDERVLGVIPYWQRNINRVGPEIVFNLDPKTGRTTRVTPKHTCVVQDDQGNDVDQGIIGPEQFSGIPGHLHNPASNGSPLGSDQREPTPGPGDNQASTIRGQAIVGTSAGLWLVTSGTEGFSIGVIAVTGGSSPQSLTSTYRSVIDQRLKDWNATSSGSGENSKKGKPSC